MNRIVHVISSLGWSGTARQLTLLAGATPRAEFEVHVCALDQAGPLAEPLVRAGIPLEVIGRRSPVDPQSFWRLANHLGGLKPDLVCTWTPMAHLYGQVSAAARGINHCLAVLREVVPDDRPVAWALRRWCVRRCHAAVVNSPALVDFYARWGLPAERLRLVRDGVPSAGPGSTTRGQLLAELHLPPNSRLIGTVGQLHPRQRLKDAIWAADLLKVIRDDVHLLVIGDGPHRDRLRRFRDQVVIRDKVHFLGQRGDVQRLLPHLDVFWSASAPGGPSLAILEAMAAGVPVVATDISATQDLVLDGQTGYLVPVGDRARIAKYANRLLNDAELARQMGQAGRQRVIDHFSIGAMVAQHLELYREVL